MLEIEMDKNFSKTKKKKKKPKTFGTGEHWKGRRLEWRVGTGQETGRSGTGGEVS